MNSHNSNVILHIVDCLLYTRSTALMEDSHKKQMDMVACTFVNFNYF